MGTREFIVLISMLMALTALSIDMMLPAFGEMRSSFGLAPDSTAIAPVITVFLIGFGAGQLFWGPLSDALGRKPVLWIGLVIYSPWPRWGPRWLRHCLPCCCCDSWPVSGRQPSAS